MAARRRRGDEPTAMTERRPFGQIVLASVLAAALLGAFWAVASIAHYFIDAPFIYTTNTEWGQDLLRSNARYFNFHEAAFHLTAGAFLLPAIVAMTWALVAARLDPFATLERLVKHRRAVTVVFAVVAVAGAAYLAFAVIRGANILDDENSYLFQATLFAHGKVGLPKPPAGMRNAMILVEPMWTSKYTPGNALALVPGVLLGLPKLVPILNAALLVLGISTFVKAAFGERQGLLAAVLVALSPFVWAVSGSLMAFSSFAVAHAWMLAGLALGTKTGRARWFVLAGAAMAWALLVRPLDAFALSPVPMLSMFVLHRLKGFAKLGLAFAGFLPFALILPLHDYLVTGSALTLPYTLEGVFQIGFTRTFVWFPYVHSPVQAIAHLSVALVRLDLWLVAAPGSMLLVALGVLRSRKNAWDRVLLSSLLCFVLAYTLVPSSGTWDVGPTYYFAIVPILVPLMVRGIHFVHAACRDHAPRLVPLAGALSLSVIAIAWSGAAPLQLQRLARLCSDIRAPWRAVATSGIGNAIVIVPPARNRHAPGYSHGYPYEIKTGPNTVAKLAQPLDEAETEDVRRFLGLGLPVYRLVYLGTSPSDPPRPLFELRPRR
jgi:hypothetical protein